MDGANHKFAGSNFERGCAKRSEPEGQAAGTQPVIPPSPPNDKPAFWRVFHLLDLVGMRILAQPGRAAEFDQFAGSELGRPYNDCA